MNEVMNALEQVVHDFIKDNGGFYTGPNIVDAMRHRLEGAIVQLVNRGVLEVKSDWTLQLKNND